MSVLIKGMAMPTSCEGCQTVLGCCDEFYDGTVWCRLAHGYIGDERTACPLGFVPPHGDLIDISAKVNAQYYDAADEEWSIKTVTVEDILSGVCEEMPPTIISAEEAAT